MNDYAWKESYKLGLISKKLSIIIIIIKIIISKYLQKCY